MRRPVDHPDIPEPRHSAQDAIAGGEECGRDRLPLSSLDSGAVEGELDEWAWR